MDRWYVKQPSGEMIPCESKADAEEQQMLHGGEIINKPIGRFRMWMTIVFWILILLSISYILFSFLWIMLGLK